MMGFAPSLDNLGVKKNGCLGDQSIFDVIDTDKSRKPLLGIRVRELNDLTEKEVQAHQGLNSFLCMAVFPDV